MFAKFPSFELVKQNELLYSIFKGLRESALGSEEKTITTKIFYDNDIEIKRVTTETKKFRKPSLLAAKMLLNSFSDEPRLQRLVYKLNRVVQLDRSKLYNPKENNW